MQFPVPSPARSLQKSLRLPRASASVAHWLFDQPHLPFHEDAPLLSALTFAGSMTVHLRDFWTKFGRNFDPFSFGQLHPGGDASPATTIDGSLGSSSSMENASLPESPESTTMDINMVLTPAIRPAPDVIAGYVLCTGPSFDAEPKTLQTGFCRGRTNMVGRFAFDMDNDHIIILFHGVTPQITGIVDITTNGLSRNRSIYAVPNEEYGPDDLPSQVVSLMVSSELRSPMDKLCSRPPSPGTSPQTGDIVESFKRKYQNEVASTADAIQIKDGSSNMSVILSREKVTVSRTYLKDIECLVSDLDYMTPAWEGAFSGQNVLRSTVNLPQFNALPSQCHGNVLSQYFVPNESSRREMISDAWRLYSLNAFGMRSQRREMRLIGTGDDDSCRSENKSRNVAPRHSRRSVCHAVSVSSLRPTHGRITKERRPSDECLSITSEKSYQSQNTNQQHSSCTGEG